jgi:ABC-type uncharacterized transport system involved in gliding motility auxiliary subunit
MTTHRRSDRRGHRRALGLAGIALAVVGFLGLNTWGALELGRYKLDVTENRQYTLAPATLDLLARLDEPVTLRLYVSRAVGEKNPFLATYAAQVRDTLAAYADAAGGRITLELVDPEPFSVEEDRAVGYGLQAVALDAAGTSGYLGLAGTNTTDDVDVIPVLSPERAPFLEYDLTRLVYNLAFPDKPVVALLTGLPINGDPALQYRPWAIYTQLGQFFDVRYMGGDITAFDADVEIVMVVHPQTLSDKTLVALDQHVLRGGRALVLVDPHSEAAALRQRSPQPGPVASDLGRLLPAWGVELVPEQVVADPTFARQVQIPSGGRQQIVPYLAWLALARDALARGEVITADLDRVALASAGHLRATAGATTSLVPLLTSSGEAQAIAVDRVATYPDPLGLIRSHQPGGSALTIAARVTGPARSAFPDALPDGVEAPAERLTDSRGPIGVVVIADTDLLDDRNWLAGQAQGGAGVPVADNANLVLNALDYLAGSEALASLRGRDVTVRPFVRIEALRREAETAYRAKEQELLERLADLQRKLGSVQVASAEGAGQLAAAQTAEIDGFRAQLLATRQELRDVQRALRQDIEAVGTGLRLVNVVAVPAAVALVALVVLAVRRARLRHRYDGPLT